MSIRHLLRMAREEGVYDRAFSHQDGKCAICNMKPSERLCIDHDHATTQVRGLLCRSCNAGIGFFLDQPKLLLAAARYLLDAKDRA